MAKHADATSKQLDTSTDATDTASQGDPLRDCTEADGEQSAPGAAEPIESTTSRGADANADGDAPDEDKVRPREPRRVSMRFAASIAVGAVVAMAALGGWFGYRAYQQYRVDKQDQIFVQAARQGAINLTTIDWEHPDADVQRILDASTGAFRDDFGARSQPFVEVVKKMQSKSVGTVTDAGLESTSGDSAQVLVAMSVKTSMANSAEQAPRSWRMRISVEKSGENQAKVSNVAFVP